MRGTKEDMASRDLSRAVRDYYLRYFKVMDRGREFKPLFAEIEEALREAESYGARPGSLLHFLVCTKFFREMRQPESQAVQKLNRRQRANLIGGLKMLRDLGGEWLAEVFGPAELEQAQSFYRGVAILHQKLTAHAVIETPAFMEGVFRRPMTQRQRGHLLEACIVCILEELKDQPKPVEATTVLLQKFGLLRDGRGDSKAIGLVKKRGQRGVKKANHPFSPVGTLVGLLRFSYTNLIDFLRHRNLYEGLPETYQALAEIWGQGLPSRSWNE